MANNSVVVRKKGKGASPISTKCEIVLSASAHTLIWTFLEGFLGVAPPFDFLHFIFGSTIVFSIQKRTAITGKKKVNFRSISVSSALMYQQLLIFSQEK